MAIFDLFSKRQKRLRGEYPDVYVYDELPHTFRVQVIHIVRDAVGSYDTSRDALEVYKEIYNVLCKEYGIFDLSEKFNEFCDSAIFNFFLRSEEIEQAIDIIELFFIFIDVHVRKNYPPVYQSNVKISPDEAIKELNIRFKEHGIGYQFESPYIIRVDSEFIHSEVVKPTLLILRGEQYAGANDEFLSAHEHYRHGRYKECLNDCLKSFESTMRTICNRRGWQLQSNATAANLIKACIDNALLPSFLNSQLESGITTVRNKLSGHGQGETPVTVPEHLARYALHLTATTILLLAEADAK